MLESAPVHVWVGTVNVNVSSWCMSRHYRQFQNNAWVYLWPSLPLSQSIALSLPSASRLLAINSLFLSLAVPAEAHCTIAKTAHIYWLQGIVQHSRSQMRRWGAKTKGFTTQLRAKYHREEQCKRGNWVKCYLELQHILAANKDSMTDVCDDIYGDMYYQQIIF